MAACALCLCAHLPMSVHDGHYQRVLRMAAEEIKKPSLSLATKAQILRRVRFFELLQFGDWCTCYLPSKPQIFRGFLETKRTCH